MSEFTDYIEAKLFSDEARDKVVVALNANINIPFINEKTEAKVLGAIWAVIVDVLKQIWKHPSHARKI